MAQLDVQGFNAFEADLEAAKNLTEAEAYTILEAGGEVIQAAMRAKLRALGLVRASAKVVRQLIDSIEIVRKRDDRPFVLIEPQGKHHQYRGPDAKGKRGKGALKTATADEVGFVLEYGVPSRNIPAHHWMETAITESEGDTTEAMQNAFNEVLDAKGVGQ